MSRIIALGVTLGFLISTAPAKDSAQPGSIYEIVSGVPRTELPAKVGEMIRRARPQERESVTVRTVKIAVRLNVAATPAIVGSAAQAAPDLAAVAAGAAAKEQPKQARAIAKAAAGAAPQQAGRIVMSVCRVVPAQYRAIVLAVAEVVPGATEEILRSLAIMFPEVKDPIETALAASSGKPISIAGVLDSASLTLAMTKDGSFANSVLARDGSGENSRMSRPPFIPLSGNGTSGTQSGRNYATP